MNNELKFIPTSTLDIENSPDFTADVIHQNTVKCRPVLPKMDHADFIHHKDGTVSCHGKTEI